MFPSTDFWTFLIEYIYFHLHMFVFVYSNEELGLIKCCLFKQSLWRSRSAFFFNHVDIRTPVFMLWNRELKWFVCILPFLLMLCCRQSVLSFFFKYKIKQDVLKNKSVLTTHLKTVLYTEAIFILTSMMHCYNFIL